MPKNPHFPSRRMPVSRKTLGVPTPNPPNPTPNDAFFRGILRQAIQMLRNPGSYHAGARRRVAYSLAAALALNPNELVKANVADEVLPPHTDAEAPQEYEPGCDNGEEWP